jgi:hypothetical protein
VLIGYPDIAAGDRLDAACARRAIELDQSELVRKIGERERRHAVGCRRVDRIVDANRSVRDRILAVQPQVNEAGR